MKTTQHRDKTLTIRIDLYEAAGLREMLIAGKHALKKEHGNKYTIGSAGNAIVAGCTSFIERWLYR